MDKSQKGGYTIHTDLINESSKIEVILVAQLSSTVLKAETSDDQQFGQRVSKAAALFEDISITPAFNMTLVELSKEGK